MQKHSQKGVNSYQKGDKSFLRRQEHGMHLLLQFGAVEKSKTSDNLEVILEEKTKTFIQVIYCMFNHLVAITAYLVLFYCLLMRMYLTFNTFRKGICLYLLVFHLI